jgi:hypothetical protein
MAGNSPTHRISVSTRDGDEIDFTNYKGEETTKRYAPFAVIFPSKNGKGGSLMFDKAVEITIKYDGKKYDAADLWINVNEVEDRDEERPARKPAGKPKSSKRAEPEESDEDDGELDF